MRFDRSGIQQAKVCLVENGACYRNTTITHTEPEEEKNRLAHQRCFLLLPEVLPGLRAPYLEVACAERMSHSLFLNELQNNTWNCLN